MTLKRLSKIEDDYAKDLPKGNYLDCALGHNPFGCSPRVLEGITRVNPQDIYLYPSGEERLKESIAEYWGNLSKEEIFLGAGSMGCLQMINKLLTKGSVVLGYAPQFLPYINDAIANGAVYEYVPLKEEDEFSIDVNEIINNITKKTTFIYVDNPHNPTGQVLSLKDIKDIVEEAEKKGALVIVDEAFGDFMPKKNSAISLENENIIVTRSFSKGFGLAGLRIGYCIARGEIRRTLTKIHLPFSTTMLSIKAAVLALEDKDFLKTVIEGVKSNKARLIKFLKKEFCIAKTHKATPIFLCGRESDTYSYFLERGIVTVPGGEFINLDNSYIRIRVPSDVEEFLKRVTST
ncbi:histidinol-phosphate aminotransferase family protein [Thermococcus argininiproducens]|uniref:Aminotransferase n=1 Tax=Thermococcus argininiproducens TaxID=2866384 RepID=A0A9E7SCS6_9EURY|nr:histidinol-phosphate transaminase [Thermococcus argininiproducens]USG99756.1 histidinol-phosphate aminotransferase family protein [Thermococcus argininiproducens]